MFGSIKAPAAGAQTRNMTIKPLRILGGRGVGKGAKALNRSKGYMYQDFWRRGARCTPSISNINIEWENVRLQSTHLAPQLEVYQ